MKKIKILAKNYAETYKDCFNNEATTKWIKRFARCRWENTVTEIEIDDEERENEKLRDLFIREFAKETQRIISERPKKPEVKETKKKTSVKRKVK